MHGLQMLSVEFGYQRFDPFAVGRDVANDTDHILVNTQIDDPDNVGNIHLSYNIPNGLSGGNIAHIGMFYGPCFEDMPGYISAHCIEEDKPKLIEAGNRIAEECYRGKKHITCIVTRKED